MRQKNDKDTNCMSFTDNEVPPDPKVKETETLDQAEVNGTSMRILQYIKERSADNQLVYRKELEMITQNTDEIIDAAVEKLKHGKEISEMNKNEFRIGAVSKPLKQKDREQVKDRKVQRTMKKQNEVKKMRGKSDLDKFEIKDDDAKDANNDEFGDDVYDLTDNDMPTQMFDGEKIDMDEILDETIIIRDMTTRPSSFSEGDYAILQIEVDGELRVALTGSKVLIKQINEKADRMPFRCKVIEQKSTQTKYSYYTLAPMTKSKEMPSF